MARKPASDDAGTEIPLLGSEVRSGDLSVREVKVEPGRRGLVVAFLLGALFAGVLALWWSSARSSPDTNSETTASTTTEAHAGGPVAPVPAVGDIVGRLEIAARYVGAPYRGAARDWGPSIGPSRIYAWVLADPSMAAGEAPRGAIVIIDATKRARVFGPTVVDVDGHAVRTLRPVDADGATRIEWDAPGFGIALIARGLSIDEMIALGETIETPDVQVTPTGPTVDPSVVGLVALSRRSVAADVGSSTLIGQGGPSGFSGYYYSVPGSAEVGAFEIVVVRNPAVLPSDLWAVLGRDLPAVRLGDRLALVFDATSDNMVGGRATGLTRLVWEETDGVIFELVSDQLSVDGLVDAALAIDTTAVLDAVA